MRELPTRKRNRLKGYDYSSAGCYFITMCVKDKHEILGKIVGRDDLGAPHTTPHTELSEYGTIVQKYIDEIHLHHKAVVDKYVIMPNHVHLIITVNDGAPRSSRPTTAIIPKIITSLKKMSVKEIGFNLWQTSYHDHIIRNEKEYLKIWQYIDTNPSKWFEDCYYMI